VKYAELQLKLSRKTYTNQEERKIASAYNYKNCLSGVLMTVVDANTLSWKYSRRFWAK